MSTCHETSEKVADQSGAFICACRFLLLCNPVFRWLAFSGPHEEGTNSGPDTFLLLLLRLLVIVLRVILLVLLFVVIVLLLRTLNLALTVVPVLLVLVALALSSVVHVLILPSLRLTVLWLLLLTVVKGVRLRLGIRVHMSGLTLFGELPAVEGKVRLVTPQLDCGDF